MKNVLLQTAIKLNRERKHRTGWRRISNVLAAVVVFCTTYALILPAITMEQEAACGFEAHVHDEACYMEQTLYDLQCSLEPQEGYNVLHSHDVACFGADGALRCTLEENPEHVHEDACYETSDAACQLPESEGHTHSDECAVTESVQICSLTEAEEHVHEEACYTPEGVLQCGKEATEGHTHTDDCFEEQVVPCELEESEGHTHSEACTASASFLICEKEERFAHLHEENCYDAKGNLICELPQAIVHNHEAECLVELEETLRVLSCEIPEHTHEDACYPLDEETDDGILEYLCGSGEHTHGETCVDAEGNLNCTIPEHIHEAACVVADLDMTADVENAQQWEASLGELELSGNWPKDVLAVAESQLDYQESVKNVILKDDQLKGYTRYGEWYGDPYGDWNAMFVSFVLDHAGVEDFPLQSDVDLWIAALEEIESYSAADTYSPKPGDLVFFDYDQKKDAIEEISIDADHVGIVVEHIPATLFEPAKIKTVEGNISDKVAYVTYELDDPAIIGYGELPEQMYYCGMHIHGHNESCMDESGAVICGLEEHTHSESCAELTEDYFVSSLPLICTVTQHTHSEECFTEESEEPICGMEEHSHVKECYDPAEAAFVYEDDNIFMTVNVVSYTGIPEGVSMTVTELDYDDEAYTSYEDYAVRNGNGELLDLVGYEIHFYLAGEEIELPDAEITAELTIKSAASADSPAVFSQTSEISLEATHSADTLGAASDVETESTEATEPEATDDSHSDDEVASVTVLKEDRGSVAAQGTVTFEDGQPQSNTFTVVLGTGRTIALASAAAPEFTVEYYTHFPKFQYVDSLASGQTGIEIIDTRGDGNATGGHLPTNTGNTTSTGTEKGSTFLLLESTGRLNTKVSSAVGTYNSTYIYEVMTRDELTKVYKDAPYVYSSGMNIMNVDKLHENTHYELSEIWVSYNNGTSWTAYTGGTNDVVGSGYTIDTTVKGVNLHSLAFTNNADNTENLLVNDDTIIRMVYTLVDGTQNVSANLFDYDITDTDVYARNSSDTIVANYDNANDTIWYVNNYTRDDGNIYMQTVDANGNNIGINSPDSYVSNSGSAHFAFGNANTGVTYQTDSVNGDYINQANRTGGFKYCHFGLVKGYDILTDTLDYHDSISHQALFNDEAYYMQSAAENGDTYVVEGKTSYYRQYLTFDRTGDTYILISVNGGNDALGNGVSVGNLDEFNYTANSTRTDLLSNNFWPMDGTSGDPVGSHDMEFGGNPESPNRKWFNRKTKADGILPDSDDGIPHNSYFGMQFSVEFTMDGEYCGPLEYLFYGDDDMWVFLTDLITGESKLICDIGGVHSSVGSITNLWDYIPSNSTSTYRLTFFYTERGASGSSCYMEFTLPDVTSVTQNTPQTGSVSVEKEVSGGIAPAEESFQFLFELSASVSGSTAGLNDAFSYTILNADNAEVSTGTIRTGENFSLKHGQKITIVGIPMGLNYTITEQLTDAQKGNYNVSWTGTTTTDGSAVTGAIESNKSHTYKCLNTSAGSLTITKEVNGTHTEASFEFTVTLADAEGNALSGTFGGYTFTDGSLSLTLASGETATITNLPAGTAWTVTETAVSGYRIEYQVDGTPVDDATGTIDHDTVTEVVVVNYEEYLLPETGGMGTQTFTFGGLLITAAAIMYICESRRKRRKGGV